MDCGSLGLGHGRVWVSLALYELAVAMLMGSIGRHVSMLEMTKLVPQLLRRFDIEWTSPSPEWDIVGYWFAKQNGVVMRLRKRRV